MAEQQSSFTAEAATMFRAAESSLPEEERACYDPLAAKFLGSVFAGAKLDEESVRDTMRQLKEAGMGPAYAEVVARTAYIDGSLHRQIESGITQLVVLGAGFDTRAYRFEALTQGQGNVTVFEVDHPAIQELKRARVEKALGALPAHVTYVPVDFDRDDLGSALRGHGYDGTRRTAFIWEGVTMYLDAEAVDTALSFVARRSGPGSSIVFDYIHRSSSGPHRESAGEGAARQVMERWGETHTFGMDPDKVESYLEEAGFREAVSIHPEALAALYPALARRGFQVAPYISLVLATV